jgi:TrmH family RNA methyltransferase
MITSTTNPRVKWVRELQSRSRTRRANGLFVAEGVRWAEEFLAIDYPVRAVFHVEESEQRTQEIVDRLRSAAAETVVVSDPVMRSMSDTESPQGLLVVAPQPRLRLPEPLHWVVLADRLSDPGNLGTLIRTTAAAGANALLLSEGSVDPWNPKVVRAAMGALLHLPLRLETVDALRKRLQGLTLWLAEPARGVPYTEADWRDPCALIVGSEAHGAQAVWSEATHFHTHIPMANASDSLNAAVAAAIILFEIRRQRGLS